MTQIDVFERSDGSQWADYGPSIRADRLWLRSYPLATRGDFEALITSPGEYVPDRVRALAQRALKEFLARNQQPEPVVYATPTMISLRDRGFFGRMRYLFTGK